MEGKTIQLLQISMEDFRSTISQAVSNELSKLEKLFAMNQQDDSGDLLTRTEASKMLQVSLTTLHHWHKDGTLTAHKVGRKVFYFKQDVIDKIRRAA